MSPALSNLSLSIHLPSPNKTNIYSKLLYSRIPLSCTPNGRGCNIKATAKENRESNFDHLQRASKHQNQPQPKKRAASVGLWDRYPTARTVQQMMETMERMMEDPIGYSGGWPSSPLPRESGTTGGGYSRGRTPWEIKEGENEYKMRFDMPGMTKEDVKMWVEEKMLVVKAEKMKKNGEEGNGEEEEEEEEWSAHSYGRYSCRIALPENIQFEKIKAEVKDGVLYISMPKASSLVEFWTSMFNE